MVARQLHDYGTIGPTEKMRLDKQLSGKGGGWQGAMYRLRFCCSRETRTFVVPDELYQTLKGYVEEHGSTGGWQGRIPHAMMDEILDQAPQVRQGSML